MLIDLLEIDFFYINLDEDKERNLKVTGLLSNLGIKEERIKRISAIRAEGIPQDGVFRGCFLSQLKAFQSTSFLGYSSKIFHQRFCWQSKCQEPPTSWLP